MLDIKGVKKSYGEFQLDCSLNVEKGRITGLVGENGAGKSTVFKAVLGLISYDGGEIKILGKKPQELNEKEKEQMGVVLAEAGFSGYLKGKDVEAVLAKLYPKFEEEKFLQMCERYQIPLDKFLKEYSTGMKAKLNLIIALTHQALDKNYILKERKENFGIACLTNEKQYYTENYPEIVVESGSLDQVILMLTGGGM